jgi:hypothetical protein
MVRLPLADPVPCAAVGKLQVRKDGKVFSEARAVGLGWERFFIFYRGHGHLQVGDVTAVNLRRGTFNADKLELFSGRRWHAVKAVDVELTAPQQR